MADQNALYLLGVRQVSKACNGSMGLDLSIPHDFDCVAAEGRERARSYCDNLRMLAQECEKHEGPLQPFLKGRIRPLTVKETIEARVEQWERSKGHQQGLWYDWLVTFSGIAYKAESDRFKIIQSCDAFMNVGRHNSRHGNCLELPYETLSGTELDRTVGVYDVPLSKPQVREHPGWLALVEGDVHLLKAYADITFRAYKRRDPERAGRGGMNFRLGGRPKEDSVYALSLFGLDLAGNVATETLGTNSVFAVVVPKVKESKSQNL